MSNQNLPPIVLPVVSFEYPNSKNSGVLRRRLVRLVRQNNRYVEGYEITNLLDDQGKYKKFSLNRIVQNGVTMVEFNS